MQAAIPTRPRNAKASARETSQTGKQLRAEVGYRIPTNEAKRLWFRDLAGECAGLFPTDPLRLSRLASAECHSW